MKKKFFHWILVNIEFFRSGFSFWHSYWQLYFLIFYGEICKYSISDVLLVFLVFFELLILTYACIEETSCLLSWHFRFRIKASSLFVIYRLNRARKKWLAFKLAVGDNSFQISMGHFVCKRQHITLQSSCFHDCIWNMNFNCNKMHKLVAATLKKHTKEHHLYTRKLMWWFFCL